MPGAVEAVAGAVEAAAEGGPAVAVSPEAAVAVVPGQAEENTPGREEITSLGHLPLREVFIVPVWSVLAPGVLQVFNEKMAGLFLSETRVLPLSLSGHTLLTPPPQYPPS